jgi:hypothetical protein
LYLLQIYLLFCGAFYAAIAYQTEDGGYQADSCDIARLIKGDIVFGMLPGQGVFFAFCALFESNSLIYRP